MLFDEQDERNKDTDGLESKSRQNNICMLNILEKSMVNDITSFQSTFSEEVLEL